ncbi:MAG: hypothetical protein J5905_06560 [Prevotella sp.]|nr:hypothetical protein [Prevotella sp.]
MNRQRFLKTVRLLLITMFVFTFSSMTAQSVKKYYWQSIASPGEVPRAGDGTTYIKVYRSEDNKPYKILNGNRIDPLIYERKNGPYKVYMVEDRPNIRYMIRPEQVMEVWLLNSHNEDAVGVVSIFSEIQGAKYGIEGGY